MRGQLAKPGLPVKWPLKRGVCFMSRIWLQDMQRSAGIGGTVTEHCSGCSPRSTRGRNWCRWPGSDVWVRHWWDGRVYASDSDAGTQAQPEDGWTAPKWSPVVGSSRLKNSGLFGTQTLLSMWARVWPNFVFVFGAENASLCWCRSLSFTAENDVAFSFSV